MRHLLAGLLCTMIAVPAASAQRADEINSRLGLTGHADGVIVDEMSIDASRIIMLSVDGEEMTLEVEAYSNRSPNYMVRVEVDGQWRDVQPGPINTYRGGVVEHPGWNVALGEVEGGFTARINRPDLEPLFLESKRVHFPGAAADGVIVYEQGQRLPRAGTCATAGDVIGNFDGEIVDRGTACGGTLCVAELACDADFDYFQDYGSVGAVESRINNIINTVNQQYESQVQIKHEISAILVRTSSGAPYTSTNSSTLLSQFRNEWLSNQSGIQRDVAHLFTGKQIQGSVIGQAWTIGGICTDSAYCHAQSDCCGSFGCTTDLTAHELGHLWGAFHCSCPSNTMNPGITCTNDFSNGTINSIVSHRNSRSCLGAIGDARTSIPFSDGFPTSTLDPALWFVLEGTAGVSTVGVGEPSGPNSLNLTGGDSVSTAFLDNAGFVDGITLSYWWQRTGGGNSPENGEDLVVEFQTPLGPWIEIARHPGQGSDSDPFQFNSVVLPNEAEHGNLRIRFRNLSGNAGFDDFFVDDVNINGSLLLPAAADLVSPADGASGVSQTVLLDWTNAAQAEQYRVLVDDDPGFGSPEVDVLRPISQYQIPIGAIDDDTQYFWTVTSINPNGSEPSPDVFDFMTLIDCNGNGVDDATDISGGFAEDCNGNGVPDSCDVLPGGGDDCNGNGIPDECDIASGFSGDCNGNGVPDECEGGCNNNGVPDECDIASGTSEDCNGNGIPDECEIVTTFASTSGPQGPIGFGSPQAYLITAAPAASETDDVTLTFEAFGDLGGVLNNIAISINGLSVGTIFESTGSSDCPGPAQFASITVSASTYNSLRDFGGGDISIEMNASENVSDDFCSFGSFIDVTIELEIIDDALDSDGNGVPDECDVAEPCPGDGNGDDVVDFDDLNLVLGNWNTAGPDGDLDESGLVDFDDLNLVLSNWNVTCN